MKFRYGFMIISFANHKGGTGKTTSTINVGRVLSDLGYRVLLIDMDPQANLTFSMGFLDAEETIADVMMREKEIDEIVLQSNEMHLVPASPELTTKREFLERLSMSEFRLRDAIERSHMEFDFILIDCPPTLSIYTINALNASDGVIIPMLMEILSVQGLDQIIQTIYKIQSTTNSNLAIIGVLGVLVNESRNLTKEILEHIRDNYYINVFNNYVRNNVRAAEAPANGMSVIEYAPASSSARDYASLTNELLTLINYN